MNRPAHVLRGRAPDELVLIDADGRGVLLRGDGVTPDERVRMAEAAFRLLGGTMAEAAR